MSGFSNRYGKSSTPHERAAMAMIKRKKKSDFVKSDGRPPDTPKDAPTSTDDQGYDFNHIIPWSFHTVYSTPPHTRLFVTNTCRMDTVLMGLFHICKFNDDMLGYFIGEGPSLNTVLNLINEKNMTTHACREFLTSLLCHVWQKRR